MFPRLKINPDDLQRNKLKIHRTVESIELHRAPRAAMRWENRNQMREEVQN